MSTCCLHVVFMLSSCCLHVVYIGLHVVYMSTYCLHVVYMLSTICQHVVYTLSTCFFTRFTKTVCPVTN